MSVFSPVGYMLFTSVVFVTSVGCLFLRLSVVVLRLSVYCAIDNYIVVGVLANRDGSKIGDITDSW